MKTYILQGNEKDVSKLIKEQRIRIGRGLVKIVPSGDAGLVSREEMSAAIESQKEMFEAMLREKETLIAELEQKLGDKTFDTGPKDQEEGAVTDNAASESPVNDPTVVSDEKDIFESDKKEVDEVVDDKKPRGGRRKTD